MKPAPVNYKHLAELNNLHLYRCNNATLHLMIETIQIELNSRSRMCDSLKRHPIFNQAMMDVATVCGGKEAL